MDFEFRRDIYGNYQAQFSMGHEVLGRWLIDELGSDAVTISSLLIMIERLESKKCWEHNLVGRELLLNMNQDGVEVRVALLDDLTGDASNELNHYDQESFSCCGLDDFRRLLEAWSEFTLRGSL